MLIISDAYGRVRLRLGFPRLIGQGRKRSPFRWHRIGGSWSFS
ncbi:MULTISPECIES: hypothetical protein [Nostoc cyanobionts]|nr:MULTISPECIES: hypothetical protein [unclassified Nostoc]